MNKFISPKISKLAKEIESNNINVLNNFWTSIEDSGTPLIEEISSDNNNVLVTFLYKEKEAYENVLIFGSFPGYNYLDNLMEKLQGTDIWFKTYIIRNDVKFKYKFLPNYQPDFKSVYKNSITDPLNPNKVVSIKDEEDPEGEEYVYSFVKLPNTKPDIWTLFNRNVNKGKLNMSRFHSEILNNTRRIWVYTPYGYSEQMTPCNLLVLTDGFDYINSLSVQIVLDNLINSGEIPPTICVLIDTTLNRYAELTCNESFSRFLAAELMHWIYKNYNVTKKAKRTIIGGVSLGGLAASYIALKNYNIFGNVLSQSGSYWYESEWLTKEYRKTDELPINFYLNVGILEDRPYDTEPIMMDVINNMRDVLLSKGYNVTYEIFNSGHDYLGWGETLAAGLKALTSDNNTITE